ncbi:unnamed protein product [Spirodela intermedia]|uniref:Uncharacterized protein n=2 Tax=Spirodela intermedia TaxID=51605 RepID=A0A7I8IV32_SPIIN|nr:unnamed protein product [Spirodela intermedia]CAA6661737.1 unnamed protein product [Spirodela intermedia]CAA7398108.1 unnamed protein product [Spirodela intermedia]
MAAAVAAASAVSLSSPSRACRHPLVFVSSAASSFSLFSPPKSSSRLRSPAVGISLGRVRHGPVAAASGETVPSEALVEGSQRAVVAATDDATTTVISVLLFIAFVGLSILTVGVVYIAVADFLQKREREKFEKEETEKKKKSGKRVKTKARTGPRGFGQKVEGEDDD